MTEAPAVIFNGRLDVLAANRLGRALYAPVLTGRTRPANFARFRFPEPGAAGAGSRRPGVRWRAAGPR